MYNPDCFQETSKASLIHLIKENGFASLISYHNNAPVVSHIPLLYQSNEHDQDYLLGHMAKENSHWQSFTADQPVLAIFQGPHHYVSPSWAGTGVPTWNYAVVHVQGVASLVETDELMDIISRLTSKYESAFDNPWQANISSEQKNRISKKLVGFKIPVENIQGKFKLSQNRSLEDQQVIADALALTKNSDAEKLSTLMKSRIQV